MKNLFSRAAFLPGLALFFAAPILPAAELAMPVSPKVPKAPEGVEVQTDIAIGKGGDTTLYADLSWPKNRPTTPLPVLIWVHGGAWTGQERRTSYERRVYFSTKGYFTAAIDYRLSGTPTLSIPGSAKWPAQLEDCKYGIRWLRANAAKYNIDPNRFAIWGPSAGGHLVACLGTMNDPRFEGHSGYEGVSSKVQAVLDFCGPVDLTLESSRPAHLFGFSYASNPQAYKDASPINYIRADDPPFLVVHGDADTSVPYSQSVVFVAALQKAGVPAKLFTVPGGSHSMSQTPQKEATPKEWEPIAAAMLQFLDERIKN